MHQGYLETITPMIEAPVASDRLLDELLTGLRQEQKSLPSKLFYDQRGSQLFETITSLEEYYLTRTETAIMHASVHEIVDHIGPHARLVEYGSGSSLKTRILLDHLPDLAAYVPVDISHTQLYESAAALQRLYPGLPVFPLWADYTAPFELPSLPTARRILAYFPGSTLGNFYPYQAAAFLEGVAALVGAGGGLLIGVDLQKDPTRLHRAYNDSRGVTAAFNRNILRHINREYGAGFDLGQFQHLATYNQEHGRIEMYLVSQAAQVVHLAGEDFHFSPGETILTEVSYKYTLPGFRALAARAGFTVERVWTDPRNDFSVQLLSVA